MKVKNFYEFLGEALWKSGIQRAKSGEVRREDGVKVKTSLGTEIILQNPDYDYESLIKEILSGGDGGFPLDIDIDYLRNYLPKNKEKVLNGENEYAFILNPNSKERIVACFGDFDEICECTATFEEGEISKEDYLAICGGIAEALSKTDICSGKSNGYTTNMYFLLKSEEEMYHIYCDLLEYEGEETDDPLQWYDFEECFEDKFPNCSLETWSYNGYVSAIGLKIDYDNLMEYFNCLEFVKDFYDGLIEYASNKEKDDEEEID